MSTIGIILDLPTIKKLRAHFVNLSKNLESQLHKTESSIDEVSKTWRDENFLAFKRRFEDDKERLIPLSKKISDFERDYLAEIERRLIIYLNRK